MEPFSIACTTCHARLKVRDPAAIGQILACPKCGSMVLIAAPAGMRLSKTATAPPAAHGPPRVHVSDSDSLADTVANSFDGLDAPLSEPGGSSATPQPHSPHPTRPNGTSAVAAVASPAVEQNGSPESLTAPTRPRTGAERSPVAIRQFRQIMLLVGAACLGIVLALIVFGVIVSWWGKRPRVAVAPAPATSLDASPTNDAPSTAQGPAAPATGPSAANRTPDSAAVTNANKPPDSPEITGDVVAPPQSSPPVPPPLSSPDTDKPPTPPAPRDAPPDLKPEAPTVPALDRSAFDKFSDLVNGGSRTKRSAANHAAGEAVKPRGDEPSGEPGLPRPPQREVKVAARLEDKLAQIEYEAPLVDFIHEMSNLTNVPISFDMPVLVAKQVALDRTIKVGATNTTVQKALTAALAPLKLGLVAGDNQLLVTWPPSETTNSREVKHAVADLVGDDPERLETLGEWIVQLVAPESWEAAGGTGTLKLEGKSLVVTHNDAVQQQVQLFCDKLRQARKLPPKKYAAAWLQSVSLAYRANDKLAKPVAVNFTRPAQFTRILDWLGKTTGTRMVVDWNAVAENGWNPDATVAFVAENQPLPEALAALLAPMDLTFHIIDESTLQVTTTAALAGSLDIEFHPAADLAKDDPRALIERITAALGETNFRDGGGNGVLYWDTPSKSLLAALPPPQQRALAKFLAATREEK